MTKFERINYEMNVGESEQFRYIKAKIGARTNTEVFRHLLNNYLGDDQ